jgi:mannose-6-phosphate isomerase-like protein (cupin superfamily)
MDEADRGGRDFLRATAAEARARELPPGELSVILATRGTLSLEYYAPRGTDVQEPHEQDELYVVIAGSGTFVCGGRNVPFGPHDVLFVPARMPHRFEGFGDDFEAWVIFYGPRGGEARSGSAENL